MRNVNDHLVPKQLRTLWHTESLEERMAATQSRGQELDDDYPRARSSAPVNSTTCAACGKKVYFDAGEEAELKMCPYCGNPLA